MSTLPPDLTFACELEAKSLQALFANPQVIDFLQASHSAVSLGILDLSDLRANVVKQLNEIGVPVIAWLLLPKDQGYWFNLDNHPQAVARYEQFRAWSQTHNLQWARIGLDIEPDIQSVQMLGVNRLAGLRRLVRHALNTSRLHSGLRAYHRLIQRIHADGYLVEAYQFPFIVDDRLSKADLLQRLTGIVNLPEVDREVLMLYSSFLRPWGQGVLWSYAPQAQGIGIGSTGGGVELEGSMKVAPLNWAELETDLLLARRHSDHLFIFSLEGCVQQNFLDQINKLDWQKPVQVPYSTAQTAEGLRKVMQRGLWLSGRPAWLLFGLALLISAITYLSRKLRQ